MISKCRKEGRKEIYIYISMLEASVHIFNWTAVVYVISSYDY